MNVYAIGDLHLSATADKPMAVFGGNWEGHFEKIKSDWYSRQHRLTFAALVATAYL